MPLCSLKEIEETDEGHNLNHLPFKSQTTIKKLKKLASIEQLSPTKIGSRNKRFNRASIELLSPTKTGSSPKKLIKSDNCIKLKK